MMTRLLFSLCLFLCAALPAAAWSHWKAFHPVLSYGEKPFVIHRLAGPLKSDKITFCLEGKIKRSENAYYSRLVQKSLTRWFTQTAAHIRRSGRAAEFDGILTRLDNPPAVTQIQCPSEPGLWRPDLRIFIGRREDIQKQVPGLSGGAFKWDRSIMYMDTTFFEEEKFERVLTHEFGHALGLADRYNPGAAADGSAFYSTPTFHWAMMNTAYDIQCDDAEGVINLLDRIVPSERSRKGWQTICPEKEQDRLFYRNGKPEPAMLFPDKSWIGAGAHRIDGKTAYFSWDANALALPGPRLFAAEPFVSQTLNADGLPAVTQSQNGTHAFYFYGKDKLAVLLSPQACRKDQPFEESLKSCQITPYEKIIVEKDEDQPRFLRWHKKRQEAMGPPDKTNTFSVSNSYSEGVLRFKTNGECEAQIQDVQGGRGYTLRFTFDASGKTVRESINDVQRKRTGRGEWGALSLNDAKDKIQAAAEFERLRAQICPDDCQREISRLARIARQHLR